ncbi:uncharacterized protein MELLADRAFT_104968 [Melampsora larici-populina 98AG31]|uniref:Uncharacterized protein n=1 Tax=Melampsora larici-populina (strain 98AG31 / pathotype 3-4-7) TaxID=747676 RepID=F4RG29_MELLP|nr:uncharacterized protein MELLADRAFT_104968 [Melampsora larici-populina 98AG31]EGG08535.1 hypothetical protein MELLADRAFT_104968 [Melampsora larici-populina 98AG31]
MNRERCPHFRNLLDDYNYSLSIATLYVGVTWTEPFEYCALITNNVLKHKLIVVIIRVWQFKIETLWTLPTSRQRSVFCNTNIHLRQFNNVVTFTTEYAMERHCFFAQRRGFGEWHRCFEVVSENTLACWSNSIFKIRIDDKTLFNDGDIVSLEGDVAAPNDESNTVVIVQGPLLKRSPEWLALSDLKVNLISVSGRGYVLERNIGEGLWSTLLVEHNVWVTMVRHLHSLALIVTDFGAVGEIYGIQGYIRRSWQYCDPFSSASAPRINCPIGGNGSRMVEGSEYVDSALGFASSFGIGEAEMRNIDVEIFNLKDWSPDTDIGKRISWKHTKNEVACAVAMITIAIVAKCGDNDMVQ